MIWRSPYRKIILYKSLDPSKKRRHCSRISGFVISKCVDYGIYAQLKSSLLIDNIKISDTNVGISTLVYGANARKHEMAPKFVKISNVEIEISNYTINDENVIIGKTQNLRSPRNSAGGRIGIIIPTFSSDLNRAPIDEWSKVWSDPALFGASCVSNAIDAVFYRRVHTKFDPLNNFFNQRTSYNFKA